MELKPDGYSVRLTIIDFLAGFIPGTAWLAIIVAIAHHGQPNAKDFVGAPFGMTGTTALIPCTIIALIIGYAIKPIAMELASYATFDRPLTRLAFTATHRQRVTRNTKRPRRMRRFLLLLTTRRFAFPYAPIYQKKTYYGTLVTRLQQYLALDERAIWRSLPRYPPFSLCKRIVQVLRPDLWEELEHREAETRMLAALTLAAPFGTIAAAMYSPRTIPLGIAAYFISAWSFRRSRRREVEYVYLDFIIATATTPPLATGLPAYRR